ncbi:MAG: hypothetical protein PHR43_06655 [Dehalococcoidales bacterium]|nr:hypothetical protein [Dehalococcoidales bacterium]
MSQKISFKTRGELLDYKRQIEEEARCCFNKVYDLNSKKKVLEVGEKGASHEFDIYEPQKVIGGITTSPWWNKTGSNNTGGQDRVAAELLWLTMWDGNERRVMILTDKIMASRLFERWKGCHFPHTIEIIHYNPCSKEFDTIGLLTSKS